MAKDPVPFLPRQHDEDIVVHVDKFDDPRN